MDPVLMGSKLISFVNIVSGEQDGLAVWIKTRLKPNTGFNQVLDGYIIAKNFTFVILSLTLIL